MTGQFSESGEESLEEEEAEVEEEEEVEVVGGWI